MHCIPAACHMLLCIFELQKLHGSVSDSIVSCRRS
jgi:hypothetical protein